MLPSVPANPAAFANSASLPLVGLLAGSLITLGVMVWIISRYRKWLRDLGRSANRLAQGDLSTRVQSSGPPHVAALADTLNQMASQLGDRLSEVVRQRNELGTILSSMDEGVLAIDADLRIISMNRAAAVLLRLDPAQAIDQPIDRVVRDPVIRDYLSRPLESGQGMQGEVTLVREPDEDDPDPASGAQGVAPPPAGAPRIIEAQSALLRGAAGDRLGTVLVLHDVSQLRRLESIRQDFVANVSHELRTPISAVKAASETLLDELEFADERPPDLETQKNFLGIINRQAERLQSIVEDLLSLARIEQGKREDSLVLSAAPLSPMVAAAVETVQSKADAKGISIRTRCETGLMALFNRMLLEQALINLVDNAVKYSPEHTQVDVRVWREGGEVKLQVADQGRGIEPAHLPRLFERFYRTDKARSRAVGGTGLGLSIVKHIAEAHGGRVHVESQLGQGSRFTLVIQPA
jgi:two-component system phosphate regulon sensor histidine kinase PhoR